MKIRQLVFPILFLGLGVGCSDDPKKPSKKVFQTLMQAHFDRNPYCFTAATVYPQTGVKRMLLDRYAGFIAAGFVEPGPFVQKERGFPKDLDETTLNLTPTGKALQKDGCFIAGKKEVVEVTSFTIPGDKLGTIVTDVKFKYRIASLDESLKSEKILNALPELRTAIESDFKPLERVERFQLTSEGWELICLARFGEKCP